MKKDLNKIEIELYETKFFDYRPVSPDVATLMFMRDFAKAMATYKDTIGHMDSKTGNDSGGGKYIPVLRSFGMDMRLETVRENRQFKLLAGLRRWADKHGMRYDQFWSYATEQHLKLGFQKTFINSFYNKRILDGVRQMDDEWKEKFIVRSERKEFRAASYEGAPIQKEYYDYVIRGILKRNDPVNAATMLAALVRDGELDSAYLKEAVGRLK